MASEEVIDELEEMVPAGEEGIFSVSQISPIDAEEELKPDVKGSTEGDEETGEDAAEDVYTYQTAPTVTVNPKVISEIARFMLEQGLKDVDYENASEMKEKVQRISSAIRDEIKLLDLDRYRIISQVTVCEKCDQDVLMNFLYLWKHEFDHYAIARYEAPTFFASALVFLVYKQ